MSGAIIDFFPQTTHLKGKYARLGLVSRIFSGGTPDKGNLDYWEGGDIPWIGSGEVNQGIVQHPTSHITRQAVENSATKLFPKDSLIMALAGQGKTKGTVARMGIEAYGNQSLGCISDYRGESRFLYWWLSSMYREIRNLSSQETRDGLNQSMLGQIPVPLFDLATQRQIANFLDRETARIDLLIEKKQQLVVLLGEKKDAELSRLEQELFADARKVSRLSYHVTKVGSGKTPSGGATVYQDSGILFLRSQNIKNDGVSLDDAAYISEEIDAEMANSRVQPRDILLNITGASLGRCAIAPSDIASANVNQHVCIIRPMKHLLPEYLHILLLTPRMQGVIRAEAFSAGREGLNFESIRNFRIPVPDSLETQSNIASQIGNISARDGRILATNARSIDRLKEYRSALITAAVTGQIDVSTYAKSCTPDRRHDAIQEEMGA